LSAGRLASSADLDAFSGFADLRAALSFAALSLLLVGFDFLLGRSSVVAFLLTGAMIYQSVQQCDVE
jgi:hypothetical protein